MRALFSLKSCKKTRQVAMPIQLEVVHDMYRQIKRQLHYSICLWKPQEICVGTSNQNWCTIVDWDITPKPVYVMCTSAIRMQIGIPKENVSLFVPLNMHADVMCSSMMSASVTSWCKQGTECQTKLKPHWHVNWEIFVKMLRTNLFY